MLCTPKFKPRYHAEIVEPEDVFLISERDCLLFRDRLHQLLAHLIDGNCTVEEIVEQIQLHLLQENNSFQEPSNFFQNALNFSLEAQCALMRMEQKGYIVENEDLLPSDLAIFCDHLNVDLKEAHHRLQTTKVVVKAVGSIPTSEFISTLESLHIQVAEEGDIEVVLTDDYLHNDLDDFNQKSLQRSRPWMLVKPVGTIVWIGPIFYPKKTGCWECLAQRLRDNRPVEGFIQRHKDSSTPLKPPLASLSSTFQTALGMAATEVFKWIVRGKNKRLEGVLVTHDTLVLETQNHILVKRPQCPSCGEIAGRLNRKPLPIILGHRKKTFTVDGGHRCVLPEETLRKYQQHISPITGVVRELGKIFTGSNAFTHTYVAKHHFATIFDDLNSLRQNLGGRSAGKGRTDQQARASGFCEAIERYSGVFQGDEIRHKGSYQQMGDKAIHPNACMNFSQAQYDSRQEWNASCSGWFQKVPEPFDEEREIEWTPVWSLTHQEFKYLPTAYCYYGYPREQNPYCWANSNGAAAGNTKEEAILQGFMELVERDGVALWWYNRVKRPAVDLNSFNDPYFQAITDCYRRINREIWVLDLRTDLNIPTFVAISRRTDKEIEDIVFGFGSHFDPKIAVLRAITETNQVLPAVLTATADGSTQYRFDDPVAVDWWQTATLENQPYLVPDDSVKPKVYSDYPQLWSDDLREDVMTCVQIAEKQGMEVLVLDQTRPDIGLNVVKVIVPGLRHFWKRLAPGRLYDVPVELGWLPESVKENQLNPFPMFL